LPISVGCLADSLPDEQWISQVVLDLESSWHKYADSCIGAVFEALRLDRLLFDHDPADVSRLLLEIDPVPVQQPHSSTRLRSTTNAYSSYCFVH